MRGIGGDGRPIDRLRRSELSVVSAGLFAVVGVLALRVRGTGLPLGVDRIGSGIVDSIRAPRRLTVDFGAAAPRSLAQPLVAWGTIAVAVALVVVLAALAVRRHDTWAVVVSVGAPALAVALVDGVAKPLVGRYHGTGLAFPSGHATTAAAAAALVLVLVNRWYGWRPAMHWAPVVALLPLAAGAGVVRLGWHYPTDVVGGVAFGAAVVMAAAAAVPGPGASSRR
ncbi:MAG: phosphatase PAP2 family protein [Acidimicrobiales bacterium]